MPRCPRWCRLLVLLLPARLLAQASTDRVRQSLGDAWWTGPVMAAGAGTLPPGHFLVEPYFYDVRTARGHSFGSSAYLVYGLADRVGLGFIPVVGYNTTNESSLDGPSSSRVGVGDVSALMQFRLTQFHEGGWLPTISVLAQETFPTGKYDRLGDRPSDGLGQGAYTTTLSVYSQTYLWLPNGRILRLRLDLSQAFSSGVTVRGMSVYGPAGTGGRAKPGSSFFADAAAEYSLTKRWVLALDVNYGQRASTTVTADGVLPLPGGTSQRVTRGSGWSDAVGFVPAVEYSWTPNLGVIVGVRRLLPGRNSGGSVTPVMAINIVR